jgi:predicted acyl esterase
MALINPHPALKVSVPMNPMVDGWMGDDWFHNGAFRQQNVPYIYEQVATRMKPSGGPATMTTS